MRKVTVGGARLDKTSAAPAALHLQVVGGTSSAAWNATTWLEEGRYVLEGRVKTHGVEGDLRNEKITRKIREHSMQKLPFILVAGDKEKEAGTVAVRARGNADLGVMSLDAFVQKISGDIAHKS